MTKDFINPSIFLIEDYPCERKEQLLNARTPFYGDNGVCKSTASYCFKRRNPRNNKKIAVKKYYEKNKEKKKEK